MEVASEIIDRIDTLRYESPTEAKLLALEVLNTGKIPSDLAPGIFGAYGSVLRMLNDFTGAERAVMWGLQHIHEDPFTEGRLYLRLSSIRGDCSDPGSAILCCQQAGTCFGLAEAADWVTSTRFSHGRLLTQCDRWEEGLDLLLEASSRINENTPEIWKGSFLNQTALAYDGVGKPEEGLKWLERSKEYYLSPWLAIRRTWTEARVRVSLEDFNEAQALLSQVINFFSGTNDIEATLARLELAQCHLAAGQVQASHALLRDIRRAIPTLA